MHAHNSDSGSEEDYVPPESVVSCGWGDDISLWDMCDICDELKEYTQSVGVPLLDSREAVNYLYELLQSRN